jgi:hypothetical protein
LKKTLALILLVLIGACRKEEGIWDELSPAERAAIRERAISNCLSETRSKFNSFKDNSALVFTSDRWQRNDAWKHELKNGTTVDTTHDIQVWKQTATELYLVITRTIGANTPETYFLRILAAANDDMIEDLQLQYCVEQITLSGSNPMTAVEEYIQSVVGGTREFTDTYSFNTAYFAYVGTAWNVSRKIVAKDADGDVTSTTNLTSSFTAVSNPDPLNTNPAVYGTKYCDITEPAADPTYPDLRYKVPYVVPEPAACPIILPGGWDLTL